MEDKDYLTISFPLGKMEFRQSIGYDRKKDASCEFEGITQLFKEKCERLQIRLKKMAVDNKISISFSKTQTSEKGLFAGDDAFCMHIKIKVK